jgi:A/G-specific adenine glycosylase
MKKAADRTGEDPGRVRRILNDLAREGFVAENEGTYTCR